VHEGLIAGPEHIRAELGEVVAGLHPGRTDPGELTVFRSLGLAIEDMAAAERAAANARARGLGTDVEL
jgi:ornithine cyclodeaminase